jgi:hypothetical protein
LGIEAARRIDRAIAQVKRDLLLEVAEAIRIDEAEQLTGLLGIGQAGLGLEEVEELEVVRSRKRDAIAPQTFADPQTSAGAVVLVGILHAEVVAERRGQRRRLAQKIRLRQIELGQQDRTMASQRIGPDGWQGGIAGLHRDVEHPQSTQEAALRVQKLGVNVVAQRLDADTGTDAQVAMLALAHLHDDVGDVGVLGIGHGFDLHRRKETQAV